jgi:hypothetical protein
MSQESNKTTFPAGDFISEDAVRGGLGRRRRTAAGAASPSPRGSTPLRRWSVAELVARAVAHRPVDGMSR